MNAVLCIESLKMCQHRVWFRIFNWNIVRSKNHGTYFENYGHKIDLEKQQHQKQHTERSVRVYVSVCVCKSKTQQKKSFFLSQKIQQWPPWIKNNEFEYIQKMSMIYALHRLNDRPNKWNYLWKSWNAFELFTNVIRKFDSKSEKPVIIVIKIE